MNSGIFSGCMMKHHETPMFCPHSAYTCLFSGRIPFHSHSTCRKFYTRWSFQDPKSEVPAIFLRPKFQGICPRNMASKMLRYVLPYLHEIESWRSPIAISRCHWCPRRRPGSLRRKGESLRDGNQAEPGKSAAGCDSPHRGRLTKKHKVAEARPITRDIPGLVNLCIELWKITMLSMGISWDYSIYTFYKWKITSLCLYPLVNVYITNWKITNYFMGKSTILWVNPLFLWPFSIVFCMFTRG